METVDTSHLPPRPPEKGIVFRWFGLLFYRIMGWKIIGEAPRVKKVMVISEPHTSNLDGVFMVMASWIIRAELRWMVKAELTRGLIGPVIRWLGGVGVDRQKSMGMVEQMVMEYQERDRFLLAIAPEGSRKKMDHWKTGFYKIAMDADLPILPVTLDYSTKTCNLGNPLYIPTGDIAADMEIIWSYYHKDMARYPERFGDMVLRPTALKQFPPKQEKTTED